MYFPSRFLKNAQRCCCNKDRHVASFMKVSEGGGGQTHQKILTSKKNIYRYISQIMNIIIQGGGGGSSAGSTLGQSIVSSQHSSRPPSVSTTMDDVSQYVFVWLEQQRLWLKRQIQEGHFLLHGPRYFGIQAFFPACPPVFCCMYQLLFPWLDQLTRVALPLYRCAAMYSKDRVSMLRAQAFVSLFITSLYRSWGRPGLCFPDVSSPYRMSLGILSSSSVRAQASATFPVLVWCTCQRGPPLKGFKCWCYTTVN